MPDGQPTPQDVIDAETLKVDGLLQQFNIGKAQLTKDWAVLEAQIKATPGFDTSGLDAKIAAFGTSLATFPGDVEGATGNGSGSGDATQTAIPTGPDGAEPTIDGTPTGGQSSTSGDAAEPSAGAA